MHLRGLTARRVRVIASFRARAKVMVKDMVRVKDIPPHTHTHTRARARAHTHTGGP